MSYEDRICNEEFNVESSSDFLEGLDYEEMDFLYHRSNMKICNNCGEFVSKMNLNNNGLCNLCNKSEQHSHYRGTSHNASSNMGSNIDYIKKFNER